jgi:hypothetical protein
MPAGQLLGRLLLEFADDAVPRDLSAVVIADGALWLAADEQGQVERLTPRKPRIFSGHQSFPVSDLAPGDGELDIEGLAACGEYLWIVGSHSPVRAKPKGDPARLARLSMDEARFTLARIPRFGGRIVAEVTPPGGAPLRAAALARAPEGSATGSLLLDLLADDAHLGPFVTHAPGGVPVIPGKDNGFDVEGLEVRGDHVILGLRGPVLRGHAVLLELALAPDGGVLRPRERPKKGTYRKWFLDLDGLGVRELTWDGDDLLVLAGPTMALDGPTRLYRLRAPLDLGPEEVIAQGPGLERLFDVPWGDGCDHAEGLALFSWFEENDAALITYDTPAAERRYGPAGVFADVFRLR